MPKSKTFTVNSPLTAEDLNKLTQDSQIVQTTGTSTTDVMSQKATTDAINNKIKLNSSTSTTANLTIYAPTSAGSSGNILRSSGSGAPSWYSPDSANLVTKTGTQTISGAKTFTAVTTQFNNILLKNGSDNYGSKINFGDGDLVYISEPQDDIMELKANTIRLKSANVYAGSSNYTVESIVAKNFSSTANLSSSCGYIKYSSRLLIQWGTSTLSTTNSAVRVGFPISFSSTNYSVCFQRIDTIDSSTQGNLKWITEHYHISGRQISGFLLTYLTDCAVCWIAIGQW